jgi:hypothetical protein
MQAHPNAQLGVSFSVAGAMLTLKRQTFISHSQAASTSSASSQAARPPLHPRPSHLPPATPSLVVQLQVPLSRLVGLHLSSRDEPFNEGFVLAPHLAINHTPDGDLGVDTSLRKARAIPPENMSVPATCSRKCHDPSWHQWTRYARRTSIPFIMCYSPLMSGDP